MSEPLPALSLVAVPGRRRLTVELAREIERRGFAGIFTPSLFGTLSLSEALAWTTERIVFGPSIAPIYARTVLDFAQSAAFLHEVSGGRFRLGIGVAHAPSHRRMGVVPGRPLHDIRAFVTGLRAVEGLGPLPPVIIAALRRKMVALAGEIGDGVVFANAVRDHMASSLGALSAARRNDPGFFVGAMIPTCIAADLDAARAVNRRSLTAYAMMPNYRNYWKEAGFEADMTAVERALAEDRAADVPGCLTDRWLDQVSLAGPAERVKEGLAAWRAAGVRTPIVVPSSAAGNQMRAIEEMFAAFAG
ncbi:MAG: LLM class flavin-dependent oxidoreductase [Rhodospirillales bacterium]|jgi:alkanesulfonate monooxygenase SsuD/methylene tetrahydromethanopterin reductase-like flavin-dependent oxidoreductase (luciferase family)|nr:LLM class flavin-dependent oxidoreductase [Rhodospirillales bacterium]